jgi:hypothetical protein
VIFLFWQVLSAGIVSVELTSSLLVVVSGTALTRARSRRAQRH